MATAGAPPAGAQTVVQVEGGGSTLIDGYGATANFWRPGADGWVGMGYLDGLRVGAFLRTSLKRDTLRLGNDALLIRFPTDIFSTGHNLLVQGASYVGGDARTSYQVFGGASSSGLGAQSFQPTSVEQPLGGLFLRRRISPTVQVTGSALFAERQTIVPGVAWQPTPDVTAAVAGGVGADRPYAASSLVFREGAFGFKGSYAWNPSRFRRVAVPTPFQTEADRENLQLTYDLTPEFTIGVGRQNFVQDSSDAKPPVRATGNSVFAGGRWREWRLNGGVYDSRSQGVRNLSSYFAVGRQLAPWLDTELFLLQSRPDGRPVSTTPVANLRWRISPRVGLMQQVSVQGRRATILFGANVMTSVGEFGVDYQIVHQPFQPLNPFRSTLNLTARLQLGSYSTNLGTYIRPDGAVDYSASGSTFLYLGSYGGVQPQRIGGVSIGRYVVRGSVRSVEGVPVEGAALDLGGNVVFTNSLGEFFFRDGRPRTSPLTVLTQDFLFPGEWEVVSAPVAVRAEVESKSRPVEILLRRVAAPVAPPAPAPAPAQPAAPVAPAPPADEVSESPAAPATLDAAEKVRRSLSAGRPGGHFAWGSRRLQPGSAEVLDSLAHDLALVPELRIEVSGHTDSTGGYRQNLRLSWARAQVVRKYLTDRGVLGERLLARGYGPDRPAADNATEAGRARNRRVELRPLEASSEGEHPAGR